MRKNYFTIFIRDYFCFENLFLFFGKAWRIFLRIGLGEWASIAKNCFSNA